MHIRRYHQGDALGLLRFARIHLRVLGDTGLDLAGELQERSLDIVVSFGTGFKERDGVGVSEFLWGGFSVRELSQMNLGSGEVDNLLLMEIALISHQHLVHMFVAVPINLPEPAHNCCEAFLVSHIVHNDDA